MDNFPKYYTRLFNGIIDALEVLQKQNYIEAQDILIKAQQDAEKMYLEDGDDELSGCTTLDPVPLIAETERMEMEIFLLESDKIFQEFRQMVRQAKKLHPEDPPPDH